MKELFIDESVFLCLASQNSLKEELISKLISFVKKDFVLVTNAIIFMFLENYFIQYSDINKYIFFINDVERILKKIYPLDWSDYKDSLMFRNSNLNQKESFYLKFLIKHKINFFLTVKSDDDIKNIFFKFNIQVYNLFLS